MPARHPIASATVASCLVSLSIAAWPQAGADPPTPVAAEGTIRRSASEMRRRFSLADHGVLLGRKHSVDWALLPALVVADIARGTPPVRWCAHIDDGYGFALPIQASTAGTPPAVEAWLHTVAAAEHLAVSYTTELRHGTLSELPVVIHWSGRIADDQGALVTDWFEPALGLHGVDFPLLPDRTRVQWSRHAMHVGIHGSPMALDAPWPAEPPSFTHLASEYDIAAAMRAWHWATTGTCAPTRPTRTASGARTPRSIAWRLVGPRAWQLEIALRESITPRSAGFTLATGDGRIEEPIEAGVATTPTHSRLLMSFIGCDGVATGRTRLDGQCGLSRMEWHADGELIAWAEFEQVQEATASDAFDFAVGSAAGLVAETTDRIRVSQQDPAGADPYPDELVDLVHDDTALGAMLCTNAWVHAARGDLGALKESLARLEARRRALGVSHHDLAALATFAESIAHAGFPAETISLVVDRIGFLAGRRDEDQLWQACDAATATGRFWAACEIATAAIPRSRTPAHAAAWLHVLGVLSRYRDDPDSGLVADCDPVVRRFALQRAGLPLDTPAAYPAESGRRVEGGVAGTAAPLPLAQFRAIERR